MMPSPPQTRTPQPAASRRVAVLIMGMHRSGTSAISGLLNRLGCDAPATPLPADGRNAKGFYESFPITDLNNRILEAAGTVWNDWSGVNPAWLQSPRYEYFAQEALALVVAEFGASPLIVLKDPRICLLTAFWVDVLGRAGYDTRMVFAVRSPADVAASLTERNGFDTVLGRLIWLRYVLEGERASRDLPRVFVSFDRLLSDWAAEVARIENGLDLRLPRRSALATAEVESFLTPSMRHFTFADADRDHPELPWIRDIQDVLMTWARHGEDPGQRTVLDGICKKLDALVPLFDPLVRSARDRAASDAARDGANAEIDTLTEELTHRAQMLMERDRKIDDLTRGLGVITRSNEDLRQELHTARIAAEAAQAETQAVRDSRSYRLTSPLRRIATRLRG